MFDPKPHLIQLPRRVKDRQTGQYITVYDDYLQVKWRLVWFREKFPRGAIETQELCVDLDRGYARYRAVVEDGEGGKATGTGTETAAGFPDYVEKAETRAVGRALAALGIGTQFVGEELSEGEHVADAPVAPASAPAPTNGKVPPNTPTSAVSREPTDRPTEAHISALTTLAVVECKEDPDVFAQRVRRVMQLKPTASVSPKLLTRTMSMSQYRELMGYYERLRAQLQRPTGGFHGTASQDTPVSESAHPPTQEASPADPFPSSSAPESAHAEAGGGTIPTTTGNGHGPTVAPVAEGYASPEQISSLKRLAARVSAEASEDLQDVLDHSPKGLLLDVYQRIEARLQTRLHGQQAAAVA